MSSPTPSPAPAKQDERVLTSPGAPLFSWLQPQYTALLRGMVIAAIVAVSGVVVASIQSGALTLPPEWSWVSSLIVLMLQSLIGGIDQASVSKTAITKLETLTRPAPAPQFAPIQPSASHPAVIGGTEALVTADPRAVDPQPAQPAVKPAPKTAAKKGS